MEPDPSEIDDENQGEDALSVDQQEAVEDERDQEDEAPPNLGAPVIPPD